MENLTESQREAFKQFRKNVSDILCPHETDPVLLKWLRARNYNPRKAEVYFREMYAFRQTYELDSICEKYEKNEIAEKYKFTGFLGFAKDGSIVRYTAIGKGDYLGYILSLSAYQLSLFCCHIMAQDLKIQRSENKRQEKEVNEITYIFDFEGFSIQELAHKCVLETALDLGLMVQDYYPEVWGNIFCINVPCYFDTAYNLFKPILKLTLIQKLQVASKESTPQLLLKYIDADVLPVFLGGNRVDSNGNPRCTEFLTFGGKVPSECYVSNRFEPLSPKDPGVHDVWIPPRGAYNHCLIARKPGGIIRIAFRTENGSINLRLLHRNLRPDSEVQDVPRKDEYLDERDEKTNVKLVSPAMWIQSHLTPVNDTCKTHWPGIYIFRFSNSHSLFGSRRLIYKVELIEPDS